MAQTFTLTVGAKIFGDQDPPRIGVKIWPIADSTSQRKLKYIKDTAGNSIITGHAEAKATPQQLAARSLSITDLPDPRDTTYGPSGFGLLVEVDAFYFRQTFMFGAAEIAAHINAGVVQLEDVIESDIAAFAATVGYATANDVATGDASTLAAAKAYSDAHGGSVASVNTKTGAVVLSASDVGADASGAATAAQSAAISTAATDATTKANAAQAAAVQRANHTGTQSADTLTDGTTNKAFLATERTKLSGVATGATANSTDAQLRDRSTHTGTQAASTITGLGTAATHADTDYVHSTAVSVATGTTQAAMDAAIAAVASTGGTVIFPPGDYTGTINLTANKPISLLGYGATIKAQSASAELIKFHQGDGNTIIGASARGFILDGNGQTGVVGLSYEDTDGATASDLFIKNCTVGVLFHTVASGKWVERCALSNTFIGGCTTGIEFRKEAAAMPSFNEVALNNVGVSQSSSIGIKQGAGCDFTRTTWDNVTIWCPDNAIGVEFAGRLDFARLQFGVESLGAGTAAKAIHVATTYTNYADPYAHHVEASIVGTFLGGRIVDDSTGGFGIVVRDGQNVISTGLGPAMFAYHNGDAFPKVKIGVAGIEFGPGNAATTSIVQSFYADYFKSFGHLLFQADPGFPNATANGGSASKAIHVYGTDDTYAGYVPIYATSDGPSVVPSNTQTGTTYTLVAADAGKAVTCNNAAAITLTVPPNSSVAYTIGTVISVEQLGAGQVTVAPGAGVAINSRGALTKTAGQYGAASLRKIATDTWILAGDLA